MTTNAYERIVNACCGDVEQAELIAQEVARSLIPRTNSPGSPEGRCGALSEDATPQPRRSPEPGDALWTAMLKERYGK